MTADWYSDPGTFLADWWGDKVSITLAERIATAPRDQLLSFAEAFEDMPRRSPTLTPGQLRPLVSLKARAGDTLLKDTSVIRGTARVRVLALYAHQVALWDPLPQELRMLRVAADQGWTAGTDALQKAICQIAELAPLTEAGIVAWLPDWDRAFIDARRSHGRTVDLTLDHLDLDGLPLVDEPPQPLYGREPDPFYDPWDDVHFAIAHVATDLRYSGNGDRVQAFFANALSRRIAPHLVELRAPNSGSRLTALDTVARLSAEVTAPSVEEIVTVRANSAAFSDWRLALERALATVELEDNMDRARGIIDAELALPRENLRREVGRSHALSAARAAGASLAWSILGASAGLLAGASPVGTAVGLAPATAIDWTRRYIQRLRAAASNRALLAHYLSFEIGTTTQTDARALPEWTTNRPQYRTPRSGAE